MSFLVFHTPMTNSKMAAMHIAVDVGVRSRNMARIVGRMDLDVKILMQTLGAGGLGEPENRPGYRLC